MGVRLEIQSSSRPEPTDKAIAVLACKTADNAIRSRDGERLHHLWEERCDAFERQGDAGHAAVITDAAIYTFRDLDNRANQARAPSDRPGHRTRRSGRIAVRQDGRDLRCAAGRAEGWRGLRPPRRGLSRGAGRLHPQGRRGEGDRVAVGLRRQARCVRPAAGFARYRQGTRSTRQAKGRLAPLRGGRARRPARLYHLYLRHDRQSQGCRDRSPEHLQLRQGCGRGVRHRADGSRLPGHDDCLRLLGRGALGAADRGGDAGSRQARLVPGGRRPRRLPARAPGVGAVLRADAARHHREGPARSAHPARLGRGLSRKPRRPLAPARPHDPQRLWADGSHRHGDDHRALSGQAGDHRRPAADLHHRHPRRAQGRGGGRGSARRDRHCRRRPGARLPQPRRPDLQEVHPGLSQSSRQSLAAHLPHGRPRPHQR